MAHHDLPRSSSQACLRADDRRARRRSRRHPRQPLASPDIGAWSAQHERHRRRTAGARVDSQRRGRRRRHAAKRRAPRGSFRRRGFTVETTDGPGSPVVFATLDAAARGILTLYIHYDGQPVNASEWTKCQPFAPCVIGPAGRWRWSRGHIVRSDWRVYGRSASDDKGPIVAVLNAVEALPPSARRPPGTCGSCSTARRKRGSANFRRFAARAPTRSRRTSP